MNRDQILAEFAACLSGDGDEDSVFVPPDMLREIAIEDLPAGVSVEVGLQRGNTVATAWNGRLSRDVHATLWATIRHEIAPKWWPEAVGARFYLDLLRRCITSREGGIDGLLINDFDDSDDVIIWFEYGFPVSGANLAEAFAMAKRIQQELEHPAEQVLNDVTRALAISADRVSLGHYLPASELLERVEAADSAASKGDSLELLMAALFEQVAGFTVAGRNTYTETEEIDLVVLNGSNDPIFSRDGPIILVECKNWAAKPGRPEFSSLEGKILNRNRRCTIAFLISWSGYAGTVRKESVRLSRESYLIVCLAGPDIRRAVLNGKFAEYLRSATLDAINM